MRSRSNEQSAISKSVVPAADCCSSGFICGFNSGVIGISAPGWLMLVSLALLAIGALWRASRWFVGRAAPLDWLGPFRVPRRYLVDVHHVVARDRYAAKMHMLTAGGFATAAALSRSGECQRVLWPPASDQSPSTARV